MKKFAAFDLDGTVFRFALFHSVVAYLAANKALAPEYVQAIEAGRKVWKNRSHPEAFWDFVRPSVEAYEKSLTMLTPAQHAAAVDAVFESEKDHVYTYTRDLIAKLKGEGFVLLAISGSQLDIVEKFARYYKFDDWVGATYEQKDGKYTGNIVYAHHNKDTIIEKLVKKHGLTYRDSIAVGDTDRDISMLEKAEHAIAFNPNMQLLKYAKKRGWKIVVERKNVAYELVPGKDGYCLQ